MKTTSRIRLRLLAMAALLVFAPLPAGATETCTIDSFGEAVDESAEALRAFSAEAQPLLRQKLETLREHKGWSGTDYEAKGLALVHDDKLDAFDAEAATLLSRIDTLGTPDAAKPGSASCETLDELKAASSELMAVMRAKSDHLIARIDHEIASTPKAAPAADPSVAKAPLQPETSPDRVPVARNESRETADKQPDLSPIRRMETPRASPPIGEVPESEADAGEMAEEDALELDLPHAGPETQAETRPSATQPEPTPPPERADRSAPPPPPSHVPHDLEADLEQDDAGSWSTTTAQAVVPPPMTRPAPRDAPPPEDDAYRQDDVPPGYAPPAPGDPPGMPYTLPDEQAAFDDPYGEAEDGYTIDEIREATRGFFGTVSTSLASVIEHAFEKSGRPTAYVLGQEGGAAFLAGLRYGEGTLYLRNGGQQKVYWHGPSLGYDIGGDGSRTLFLIYSLDQPDAIFRRFTGVDGSAYLVGGVGMTLLKGGPVTMAPIRSGIGLRLGASVGYLRFTPRPTWNPF